MSIFRVMVLKKNVKSWRKNWVFVWKTAGAAEEGRVTTMMVIYSCLHLQYEVCGSWGESCDEMERVSANASCWCEWLMEQLDGPGVNSGSTHGKDISTATLWAPLLSTCCIIPELFFAGPWSHAVVFRNDTLSPSHSEHLRAPIISLLAKWPHFFPRRPFKVYVTGSTSEWFYRRNAKAGDWVR